MIGRVTENMKMWVPSSQRSHVLITNDSFDSKIISVSFYYNITNIMQELNVMHST